MSRQEPSAKTIFRLRVPRLNERGPLAFEQVLASLHGLLLSNARKGKDELVSFELVKLKGKIYFYIVVPSHLRTLISSQVYSQYPDVEIEIVPEYFTKSLIRDKKVLLADMDAKSPWVYPFKRYPQFEGKVQFEDPLGSITSSLAQLSAVSDTAVVQFIVSPVAPKWNEVARDNLAKFFKNGIWQSDTYRALYQWARLSPHKKTRLLRAPIWILMDTLFSWGAVKLPDEKPQQEEDFSRDAQTSQRHDRESVYAACYDKLSRLNFQVNIRAVYIHSDADKLHAEAKIREIAGTFQQFSLTQLNSFDIRSLGRDTKDPIFQKVVRRSHDRPFILSQEEVATMYHLPTETVKTASIQWVDSKKLEPPVDLPTETESGITILGETNYRNQFRKYGLRLPDRRRHVYIIGKTGMGKSTLLENMIYSDIMAGMGVGVVDPHGDLADAILSYIPKHRMNDVIVFDPSDREWPVAFNMLEGKNQEQRGLVASGLVGVIKKLNIDSWGPRLEHFLRNTILALVEAPDTTMLGIARMLVDKDYREKVLSFVEDPMVQSFWRTEFSALAPAKLAEAIGPIQNKVGQFLATPLIRNIVGQPKSTLDIRFAMDKGKIVIVNLSKGKIGEDNSTMLGSLLITKFQIDAMSRADTPEADRRDFALYVDEFQNFATDSFATILSEARKYKLSLTMANQYIEQMSEEVTAAVFGNVGSLASFQVGVNDAKVLSEQFDEEVVTQNDLVNLPKYTVYNKILVDGMPTHVFSGRTLPPPSPDFGDETPAERREKIIRLSRQRYAKPRETVEDKINRWSRTEREKRDNQRGKEDGKSTPKEEKNTPPTQPKEEKPPTSTPQSKGGAHS